MTLHAGAGGASSPTALTIPRAQRRRAVAASTIGTSLEFYDFVLFATLSATVFPQVFFSGVSPVVGTFLSYATLGIGYLARPIGGIIFGNFGDRLGRRRMLMITICGMGVASVLIGLLPSSAVIGGSAAVILVVLRLLQGLAVGGEWGGAALLSMESSPTDRRGLAASAALAGGPLGATAGTLVLGAFALLPAADYMSWGWRIPFLMSAALVVVGLVLRRTVAESPQFVSADRAGLTKQGLPIAIVLRRHWPVLILTVLVGIIPLFVQIFTQSVGIGTAIGAGNPQSAVLWLYTAGSILQTFAIVAAAHLSDRFGRVRTLIIGLVLAGVLLAPAFSLLRSGSLLLVGIGFVLLMCVAQAPSYGPFGAFANELYDVPVRYTGGSLSYQLAGGIGGGIAPVLGGALLLFGQGSLAPLALVFAGMVLIGIAAAVIARRYVAQRTVPAAPDAVLSVTPAG